MLWIGGLECVAGLAHTAQVRLGIPIFNSTLSALHNVFGLGEVAFSVGSCVGKPFCQTRVSSSSFHK